MKGELRSVRETDDLYAELLSAHAGLTPEESARLNSRLVLILMGRHVDSAEFKSALAAAKELEPPRSDPASCG